MTFFLLEKGREGLIDGTVDLDTDTIKAALVRATTADAALKAITGASNATPIVVTATSHGFANGDLVLIDGVGGNLAANGYHKIANVLTNSFELTDPITGTNVVGSGAYTSGGYAVCMGPSGAGDNWDDFSAALVGTAQTLASKTVTSGVFDAADVTFPTVAAGAAIELVVIYEDTGVESTSRVIAVNNGKQSVVCAADAATSATTIWVERLGAGIPNSTAMTFSNGQAATLTALASAGDRSLTVSALGGPVTAGRRASAPGTGSGLPVTPNGNDIACAWDAGANRIFKV
jgi:hypothetical protein